MPAYSFREGFFPGGGFDSLRGDPKQRAVTGILVPPINAAGQKGGTSFLRINSVEEFEQALSVGVEIDVGVGLFGGSASFDYKSQCKVSKEATFVMVRITAINPYERLSEPKLDSEAWELLANKNYKRFKERFGDKWVSGQTTGLTFFGTVRIEASSKSKQEQIAADIEASYGFFASGSASIDSSTSMKSSDHRIEIIVQQSGGEIHLCDSIEKLFESARQALVDARQGKAAPFAVQVEDYAELKLPDDDASALDLEFARIQLKKMLQQMHDLETKANDIEFVFRNRGWFEDFTDSVLNDAADSISDEINRVREAANVCSRDPSKCRSIAVKHPQYALPKRRADAPPVVSPTPAVTDAGETPEWARLKDMNKLSNIANAFGKK
jgi:hypothetical protein